MKVEYTNPFVESIYELFATMLNCEVKQQDVNPAKDAFRPRDIVALIGPSGPARGTVALAMPVNHGTGHGKSHGRRQYRVL